MDISFIIQLFETPTCIILALAILVIACSFIQKDLHISGKSFEIGIKSKKKKRKK